MELSKRTDTIVTKADKGGAVVIMGVDEYTKEVEWQLNNRKILQKRIQSF